MLIGLFSYSQAKEMNTDVYCVGEEAEYIYEIATTQSDFATFLKENQISISKERIMKVYYFSLLDYAKNDTISIVPMICDAHSVNERKYDVYVAKVNDINNEYAGYIEFCVGDNESHLHYFSSSRMYEISKGHEYCPDNDIYIDYQDNISNFYEVFHSYDSFSEKNVKLVMAEGLGFGFYITSDKVEDVFVYPKTSYNDEVSPTSFMLVDNELKIKAVEDLKEYNELEEEYKNWKKEHPNEKWEVYGYSKYPLKFLEENINEEQMTDVKDIEATKKIMIAEDANNKKKVVNNIESKAITTNITDSLVDKNNVNHTDTEKMRNLYLFWTIAMIIAITLIIGIVIHKKKQK